MSVVTTIAVMRVTACVKRLASGGTKPVAEGKIGEHGQKKKESVAAAEFSGQLDLLNMASMKTKALVDILT